MGMVIECHPLPVSFPLSPKFQEMEELNIEAAKDLMKLPPAVQHLAWKLAQGIAGDQREPSTEMVGWAVKEAKVCMFLMFGVRWTRHEEET